MSKKDNITKGLLKGIPVSEGIAIGRAWILESPWDEVVAYSLKRNQVKKEVKRYLSVLKEVEQQLKECRNRVRREIGEEEANIFESHLSILNDLFFQKEIPESIQNQEKNVEWLLKEGVDRWSQSFHKMESDYFRHRIDDIKDVAVRILRILLQSEDVKHSFSEQTILVAYNLTPSDTARVDRNKILGFATELGGQTSHASILARSMGLPAVVGVKRLMQEAQNGDLIVVDGNSGIVYVDPPERIITEYEKLQKQFNVYWNRLSQEVRLPAVTTDGVKILLQANVSMTADVSLAVQYRADGIGLFRTELPFLIVGRLLSEEEQFQLYRTIVETMKDKSVTIRTLDLGGDKFLPFQGVTEDKNPFLGWRSIRISLQERDVFKIQLRAMLRASAYGHVNVLFPMISSIEEILEIREVMNETKKELEKENIPFDQAIKSGVMIEVPSVAIIMDRLVKYTDFISIGTNDLIQYTLAVDRNNEKVAKFYKPLNPAILILIHSTIQAANQAGIPVSLCGEMAGNPLYTSLLLGFGLRQLSMSPLTLTEVKERVRAISIQECEEVAKTVLKMDLIEDIEKVLLDFHLKANKKQSIPYLENRVI